MKKKILIVDDDLVFCEQLKEMLEAEGYDISSASDGRAAISVTGETAYDLCLLDLKLSDTDGAELLKAIKKRIPSCKVVVISGKPGLEKELEDAEVSGLVEDVFSKPFSVEPFLRGIKALLS
jgi:DNA-binding response OmpR family regulator